MHSRRGKRSRLSAGDFWHTPTAQDDLPLVLTAGARLPLCLWRQNFFFKGAANEKLRILTEGKFPCRAPSAGTHPIFVLTALPQRVGHRVCPCSSAGSYEKSQRYIKRGCRLAYADTVMDRNSYLVEHYIFNIPHEEAGSVRFFGAVPEACILWKR